MAGVVVKPQTLAPIGGIFAFDVVHARMGRIACYTAVMRNDFAAPGMAREHLRYRARVAGIGKATAQCDSVGGTGHVVSRGEHIEPEAIQPEAARAWHQPKRLPEI